MTAIFLFVFAALVCGASSAASFDCKAAGTPIEKLVCSDAQLSKMDEELASTYKTALASLDTANQTKLKAEQKSWLKNSRGLCDDVACLRASYTTRMILLRECQSLCVDASELYALDGENHNLVTLRDSNSRNASFSKDLLARHLGSVQGCGTLVDIAVGTAHGDHSFGGLCKLKNQAGLVMVCNDEMIGHFGLVRAAGGATRNDLADFTIRNCFGG